MMGLRSRVRTRPLAGILVLCALLSGGLFSLRFPAAPVPAQAAGATVSQAAAAPDPEPGPYAVGVTRRTFTRTTTDGQSRVLDTVIWYPADASASSQPKDAILAAPRDALPAGSGAPYPVILFSHGSARQPWNSSFFTTHLASYGFVVVAPPHPGNTADTCPSPCIPSNPAYVQAADDSLPRRPVDLTAAFAQALDLSAGNDPLLAGLLDGSRVGVTGWSFGGNTAIRTLPTDPRFLAGVALAPFTTETATTAAAQTTVPVMMMGGMLDDSVSFASQQTLFSAYPAAGAEHWLVALPHAGHHAFENSCPAARPAGCASGNLPEAQAHVLINHWATAFLLQYVAGDQTQAASLDPSASQGDPELVVTRIP